MMSRQPNILDVVVERELVRQRLVLARRSHDRVDAHFMYSFELSAQPTRPADPNEHPSASKRVTRTHSQ
jgi:hypothetical protein